MDDNSVERREPDANRSRRTSGTMSSDTPDLTKELEEIRMRLAKFRAILELEGHANMIERAQAEHNRRQSETFQERDPRVEESILKSAVERSGNMAYQPKATAAEPPDMRIVFPLESFDEQIGAMTRRLLQAADTLSDHSLRVLGPQPYGKGEGVEELLRDRPSGALDRLAERLNELTGAVIYMEGEVNRATGLA